MWELYINTNYQEQEKQYFDTLRDGKKPFRQAVTQIFNENPQLLPKFISMIDAYCDKYYPIKKRCKKPVPYAFSMLKRVLTNYVTNPMYTINPDSFVMSSYTDKNISIWWFDMDGEVNLHTSIKNEKLKLPFPKISIPLRLLENENGNCFLITDNPQIYVSRPDTNLVSVRLDPVDRSEYFDEADYDFDEDYEDDDDYDADDEDEDDEEDEAPVYTPSAQHSSFSYPVSRQPKKENGLSILERAELNQARQSYEAAVRKCKMHAHSSSLHIYQAAEKEAFARLIGIEAKYAGRK